MVILLEPTFNFYKSISKDPIFLLCQFLTHPFSAPGNTPIFSVSHWAVTWILLGSRATTHPVIPVPSAWGYLNVSNRWQPLFVAACELCLQKRLQEALFVYGVTCTTLLYLSWSLRKPNVAKDHI